MLNYECYGCDHSAYAHRGGESEKEWLASMDKVKTVEAAPKAEAPELAPAAPPKAVLKNSAFSLGAL